MDRTAAWASAAASFAFPGRDGGQDTAGFSLWVKGDGSGALLSVVLSNVPDFAVAFSEHYLKLDFTGWRRVDFLLRERDAGERYRYHWPFGSFPSPVYINGIKPEHLGGVTFYLNDIPQGAAASVEIGELLPLQQTAGRIEKGAVEVNGARFDLPFALASGEYAELEDGVWTLYDEKGGFKERAAGPQLTLKEGENKFRYSADVSGHAAARAEVKVFVRARPMPALAALTAEQRKALAWEAEMPAHWVPAKGADALPPVKVRPGEKAKLEVKVRGPVADPVLTVNGQAWKLASVPAKAVRTFTDGPVVSGVVDVKMESSDPTAADALVEFVKCYEE